MVIHSGTHVFVNNRKVSLSSRSIKASDLIKLAGYDEQKHWDLYQLRDGTDSSGGTIIGCDDMLEVKDGDYFRMVAS